MESDRAQLSALASTLDDLTQRITAMANSHQGGTREDVSQGLYEVERSLRSAARNITKVMRIMRSS